MIYLALPLDRLGLTVGGYLERLGRALLEVLADFDLKGTPRPDGSGIDLAGAAVATVGIAVNRWIAYHGAAINVGPYLAAFDLIESPSGAGSRGRTTSLEARRQRPAPMARVRQSVIAHVSQQFGLDPCHVYTDHPMIRRKAPVHAYVSSTG
jgi:lipoate-protein ligase B